MEQPTTVDLISLGIVGLGWFLLLVPSVKRGRGELDKELGTETPTLKRKVSTLVSKSGLAARVVAAKALRAVARSLALMTAPWDLE